jgi:hypothetical protein
MLSAAGTYTGTRTQGNALSSSGGAELEEQDVAGGRAQRFGQTRVGWRSGY